MMITSPPIPSNDPVITVGGVALVDKVSLTATLAPDLRVQHFGKTLIKATPIVYPVNIPASMHPQSASCVLAEHQPVSAWLPTAKVPALLELLKQSAILTLYGHLGRIGEFCVDTFAPVGHEGPQNMVRLSGAIEPKSLSDSHLRLKYLASGIPSVASLVTWAEPQQGTMDNLAVVEGYFVGDTVWIRPGGLKSSCPLSSLACKAPVTIDGLDLPNRMTLVCPSFTNLDSFRYCFNMGTPETGHDVLAVYDGEHNGVGKCVLGGVDHVAGETVALEITGCSDTLWADRPLRPARDGEVSELQATGFVQHMRADAVDLVVMQNFPWSVKTFACTPDAGIFAQVEQGQLLTITCHRRAGHWVCGAGNWQVIPGFEHHRPLIGGTVRPSGIVRVPVD
jgi:hypothetical protein